MYRYTLNIISSLESLTVMLFGTALAPKTFLFFYYYYNNNIYFLKYSKSGSLQNIFLLKINRF